jgi:hypothetical protein
MIKVCSKCNTEKPLDSFGVNKATKDGLQYHCRPCLSKQRKKSYSPERRASKNLERKFNITLEDYDALLAQQGGKCAICKSEEPKGKRFSVDHNHATGEVRGLLCNPCNMGIGLLQDSPDVLESAKEYLLERGNYGA